jgi:thioester reductase-like protein
MSGELLLTGATGFVGMEVLERYLSRTDREVIALVRADDDAGARARVVGVLRDLFGLRGARRYERRVDAVAADLMSTGLGISERRRSEIASRTGDIVHAAASVSFSLPLDEAREINVKGTRRALELAAVASESGGLRCFTHVSTAYVAGTHPGRFWESDHDVAQGFRNSYEQSKFEAEGLVRAAEVPTMVLRPSIVVGDRRSGWTAAFNVLYWPLRAFARGLYSAVPAVPSSPVDVVSIDYVADAIYELCQSGGRIGETYHLTAGSHASSVGELVELASRYFERPPPMVLSADEFAEHAKNMTGVQRSAIGQSAAYFPYFAVDTEFDNTAARARLEPAGISVSPLASYLERLLDFAIRSRWGKRPIGRAEALAV